MILYIITSVVQFMVTIDLTLDSVKTKTMIIYNSINSPRVGSIWNCIYIFFSNTILVQYRVQQLICGFLRDSYNSTMCGNGDEYMEFRKHICANDVSCRNTQIFVYVYYYYYLIATSKDRKNIMTRRIIYGRV